MATGRSATSATTVLSRMVAVLTMASALKLGLARTHALALLDTLAAVRCVLQSMPARKTWTIAILKMPNALQLGQQPSLAAAIKVSQVMECHASRSTTV